MRQHYIRSAIRAEVRRALRDERQINREYLRTETGLSWNRLEVMIADAWRNLATAPPVASGAGQGPVRPGEAGPTAKPNRSRTGSR